MIYTPTIHNFIWNKIDIEIEFVERTWKSYEEVYGTPLCRILIKCEQELPIPATGYYVRLDEITAHGGVLQYLNTWFNAVANTEKWHNKSHQLNLF